MLGGRWTFKMVDESADNSGNGRAPPYVPFRTFLTLLEDFREHGMPPQIDSSVLKRFSGSTGAQIVGALKYLAYADEQKKCLPLLKEAVDTYKTDQFPSHLRKVLTHSYPFLGNIDLTTATPSMFADAFRKNFSLKEDVLRKSRTFFIYAAGPAGIELGPRLKAGGTSSSANGGQRRKGRQRRLDPAETLRDEDEKINKTDRELPDTKSVEKPLEYQLIDLMAEPDIDQAVKDSIWSLVQYLSARKTRTANQKE